MTTVTYSPSAPLNQFVDSLWHTRDTAVYPREKILPLPSQDLMINFGGPFLVYEGDAETPSVHCVDSWCMGLRRAYHTIASPVDMHIMGVKFKPGGAAVFLNLPMSELQDQIVPLDTLWGRFAAELRECLYHVPTVQARFALLEQMLLARLYSVPMAWNAVQYAVDAINRQCGMLSIQALSDDMGISGKHLTAQFNRLIGLPPKTFARLVRFQHVLTSIDPMQAMDWSALAQAWAFYDQAHFIKELKTFTGLSPNAYLSQRRYMLESNPDHARFSRHLTA